MSWPGRSFFPLHLCEFISHVCSASSEIILWKLLPLASELNNLKVKWSDEIDWFYFPRFSKWPKTFWFGLTKYNCLPSCPNFSLWPLGEKIHSLCIFDWSAHLQVTSSLYGWFERNTCLIQKCCWFMILLWYRERAFADKSLDKSKLHQRNLLWLLHGNTWTCRFFLAKLTHGSEYIVKTKVFTTYQRAGKLREKKKSYASWHYFFFALKSLIQNVCY